MERIPVVTTISAAAAALGRRGGNARAAKLSAKRRSQIARKGGKATKGIKKKRARKPL
jgi:general stress protein YciG